MTEIDYRLFPMHRSMFSSSNATKYNAMIDDIREKAKEKFEVPEWDRTVEYVNGFARLGIDWNRYPKITPNAWKAHLKIEAELKLFLYPALFVSTYPYKDAGTISWRMFDERLADWGSPAHLHDILKKSNKLYATDEYNIIDFEPINPDVEVKEE